MGIVAAPLLGERFVAVQGAGAFLNGARIHVAEREAGDPLVGLSDFAFGRKHRDTNLLRFAVIEELVRRSMRLRIHGSAMIDAACAQRRLGRTEDDPRVHGVHDEGVLERGRPVLPVGGGC